MTEIVGSFEINLNASTLDVTIALLDFRRKINLTAGQVTTVQGWADSAQNDFEGGLITVGVVAGVQSGGV